MIGTVLMFFATIRLTSSVVIRTDVKRDQRGADDIFYEQVADPVILVLVFYRLPELPHRNCHVSLGHDAGDLVVCGHDKTGDLVIHHQAPEVDDTLIRIDGDGLFKGIFDGALVRYFFNRSIAVTCPSRLWSLS